MRLRFSSILVFAIPVAFAVAVACSGPYQNQCTSLGGACVASEDQCGGSLPYACNVGICCIANGVADAAVTDTGLPVVTEDSTAPSPDTGLVAVDSGSHLDGTVLVDTGTDTGPTGTPDVVAVDSGSDVASPVEAATEAGPGDSGHEAGLDAPLADATHDAPHDAPHQDAAADAPIADASPSDAADAADDSGVADGGSDGGTDAGTDGGDAGALGCALYSGPGAVDICTGCGTTHACQLNGCYGGYYCENVSMTSHKCVAPSKVVCP